MFGKAATSENNVKPDNICWRSIYLQAQELIRSCERSVSIVGGVGHVEALAISSWKSVGLVWVKKRRGGNENYWRATAHRTSCWDSFMDLLVIAKKNILVPPPPRP